MSVAILIAYCGLIATASLLGGWLPSLVRMTHLRQQLMMSFVSGVMLSVALLHLLPHSIGYLPSIGWAGGIMLCGVLMMFFLVRVFHVHAHDAPVEDDHGHAHCDHHSHARQPQRTAKLNIGWVGVFIGLTLHTLLDGVALAASVAADSDAAEVHTILPGFGTFLAVFLHKPLDALAITTLMRASHWPARTRGIVNCVFAATCPLGALLFWLGASSMGAGQAYFVGGALAFSAGFFLCIALADLLPEVAFHSHDRVKLSGALLLGVLLALVVELMHSHSHKSNHAADQAGDSTNRSAADDEAPATGYGGE